MKICFVGPANSAHIVKWCNWFVAHGHEVHVISFTQGEIDGTHIHLIDTGVDANESDFKKIKYLLTGHKIRKEIEIIKPDIVNAHYATSYGMALALSGIRDYILSVWGSDIYDFPNRSLLHKAMLSFSLKKAKYLFSTSQAMADEASKYTEKQFVITPFGVDMQLFTPEKRSIEKRDQFIVGTVKSLSPLYGIDYLIRAVAIIKCKHPDINMSLRIAGDGPDKENLEHLTKELGIDSITSFLGRISQEEAAYEWANMDVAVIPSISYESFGVAAVEAQSCGTPVVISAVGGLMETTRPDFSSLVVPTKDEEAIAEAILDLYDHEEKRIFMGIEGRKNVEERFEIDLCFKRIEEVYRKLLTE